jgi:hypothetical protein
MEQHAMYILNLSCIPNMEFNKIWELVKTHDQAEIPQLAEPKWVDTAS